MLTRASVHLDQISTYGSDCRIQLKVYRKANYICVLFSDQTGQGGMFQQARDVINYVESHADARREHLVSLSLARSSIRKINEELIKINELKGIIPTE